MPKNGTGKQASTVVQEELITCAWHGCKRKFPASQGTHCAPHRQRAARHEAAAGAGNDPNRRSRGAQSGNHPMRR